MFALIFVTQVIGGALLLLGVDGSVCADDTRAGES